MPYNGLARLFVINDVAEKTATVLRLKKLLFKASTKYYPVKQKPLPSLPLCLVMDFIGSAVIVIPVLGELIWAPISAIIFWRMFGFNKGFLGGIFSFIEELIPGIDFIPTFTIMWIIQYAKRKKQNYSVRPFMR
jgi:uncharacterized YccA/Bax inhibitor family protein